MSSRDSRDLPFKIARFETDETTRVLIATDGESPPSTAPVARLLPDNGIAGIVRGATSAQLVQLLDGKSLVKEMRKRARAQDDKGEPIDPLAVYWYHGSLTRRFGAMSDDETEQTKKDEKLVFDNYDKLKKGKSSPPSPAAPVRTAETTSPSAPWNPRAASPLPGTTPQPVSVPSATNVTPSPQGPPPTQYRFAAVTVHDGSVKQAIVLSDEEEETEVAAAATPAAATMPYHTPPHGTSPGSATASKAPKKPRADRKIVVLTVSATGSWHYLRSRWTRRDGRHTPAYGPQD